MKPKKNPFHGRHKVDQHATVSGSHSQGHDFLGRRAVLEKRQKCMERRRLTANIHTSNLFFIHCCICVGNNEKKETVNLRKGRGTLESLEGEKERGKQYNRNLKR